MFRMQVEFYADEDLFTKESVSFLKEKFNKEIYEVVVENIQDPRYIEIPVWPGSPHTDDWIRPEDLFSAMVNHFKSDGMAIIVRPDEDKFDKSMYGIPEEFSDVYYTYTFKLDDVDQEELENGEFAVVFDGDNTYAYNCETDEEVWVPDIDGADFIEFY